MLFRTDRYFCNLVDFLSFGKNNLVCIQWTYNGWSSCIQVIWIWWLVTRWLFLLLVWHDTIRPSYASALSEIFSDLSLKRRLWSVISIFSSAMNTLSVVAQFILTEFSLHQVIGVFLFRSASFNFVWNTSFIVRISSTSSWEIVRVIIFLVFLIILDMSFKWILAMLILILMWLLDSHSGSTRRLPLRLQRFPIVLRFVFFGCSWSSPFMSIPFFELAFISSTS